MSILNKRRTVLPSEGEREVPQRGNNNNAPQQQAEQAASLEEEPDYETSNDEKGNPAIVTNSDVRVNAVAVVANSDSDSEQQNGKRNYRQILFAARKRRRRVDVSAYIDDEAEEATDNEEDEAEEAEEAKEAEKVDDDDEEEAEEAAAADDEDEAEQVDDADEAETKGRAEEEATDEDDDAIDASSSCSSSANVDNSEDGAYVQFVKNIRNANSESIGFALKNTFDRKKRLLLSLAVSCIFSCNANCAIRNPALLRQSMPEEFATEIMRVIGQFETLVRNGH
jgi:hypothetical protein